jgi:hypothetical protein
METPSFQAKGVVFIDERLLPGRKSLVHCYEKKTFVPDNSVDIKEQIIC